MAEPLWKYGARAAIRPIAGIAAGSRLRMRRPISGGARTYRCFPVRNLCLMGFQAIASRLGFPLAEHVVGLEDRHCTDKVIPLAA